MSYEFKVGDKGKCYSDGQYEVLAIRDGRLILWCEWGSHKISVMVNLDGTYPTNHKLQYIYPPKVRKWQVKFTYQDHAEYSIIYQHEKKARQKYEDAKGFSSYKNVSIQEIEE